MFEYIAKNVGIRRASGEYVLATNPDIIFSDQIIRYLAEVEPRPDSFYRVDRYDVGGKICLSYSLEQQLQFCARHAFRVHRIDESVPARRLARILYRLRYKFSRLRRYGVVRELIDKEADASDGQLASSRRPPTPLVHLNASGDFLLMANWWWHALRGYPELATHSHIDSYMVITASVAGLHQIALPHRIYHQEHDRSEQARRPLTVLNEIPALKEMLGTLSLRVTNGENWGLGQIELPTTDVRSEVPVAC